MKVVSATDLSAAALDVLSAEAEVAVRPGLEGEALRAAVRGAAGVILPAGADADRELLSAAPDLKVLAVAGGSLKGVDLDAATRLGVLVCSVPDANAISAAEHTVGLLLALARSIPAAAEALRSRSSDVAPATGSELYGKTLGILGFGRVGRLVAQRALALGMRLLAHDPYVAEEQGARLGVELVPSVRALCEQADILTVHVPDQAELAELITAEDLRALGEHGLLVNTVSGAVVDLDALHDALAGGWITGAAMDVDPQDPAAEPRFTDLPNTLVTPRLGAATAEARERAAFMVAEAVVAALRGEPVQQAVNVQAGQRVSPTVRPFLRLAEWLGRLLVELHRGPITDLEVALHGRIADEDTRAVTLAALVGYLRPICDAPVTPVSAPLHAEERGLTVSTSASPSARDYVSLLRLSGDDVSVAGTVVGTRDVPRLVEVWGFDVDVQVSSNMLFVRYDDRPGVIGTIGRILGEADVNIAAMQVGRRDAAGHQTVIMTVDTPVSSEVVDRIATAVDAHDARTISLD